MVTSDPHDLTMGRLVQLVLSSGQPTATRIRPSRFSISLDDLLEATVLPTLEAWLVWRSAGHLLRWRPDLQDQQAATLEAEEDSKQQACQLASFEYFTDLFPLASQLTPAGINGSSVSSSWLSERIQNLCDQLISLHMPAQWADLLAEAEPVVSGDHQGVGFVKNNTMRMSVNESFLELALAAETEQHRDPRVTFLAYFLVDIFPGIEPVWLENRFYRLLLAVRLRLKWIEERVAASEFAAFSARALEEHSYADLALGLTLDIITNSVIDEEEVEEVGGVNFLHFGRLSSLEQFYLIAGSEACQAADHTLLAMVQSSLRCD